MSKLWAVISKEVRLLLRDLPGLGILFVMPVALVLVVTLVQDSAFRSVNETHLRMVLCNKDPGFFGRALSSALEKISFFSLIRVCASSESTRKNTPEGLGSLNKGDSLKRELIDPVFSGKYQVGVIIPLGASERAEQIVTGWVSRILEHGSGLEQYNIEPIKITLYFDPQIQPSLRSAVKALLQSAVSKIEVAALVRALSSMSGNIPPDIQRQDHILTGDMVLAEVRVGINREGKKYTLPTSVQQNVPAWSMFAMFFIAVPLGGNMINERREGLTDRLKTIPVSPYILVGGKSLVYIGVCMIQFVLMLLLGIYAMPLLGTPVLEIESGLTPIFTVALASALAAVGLGIFVGHVARTYEQASMFTSLAIVIAAALGGVMVPVFAMPPVMQKISTFSPLAWGLNAFLDLFLRKGDIYTVLPDIIALCSFSIVAVATGLIYARLKEL